MILNRRKRREQRILGKGVVAHSVKNLRTQTTQTNFETLVARMKHGFRDPASVRVLDRSAFLSHGSVKNKHLMPRHGVVLAKSLRLHDFVAGAGRETAEDDEIGGVGHERHMSISE